MSDKYQIRPCTQFNNPEGRVQIHGPDGPILHHAMPDDQGWLPKICEVLNASAEKRGLPPVVCISGSTRYVDVMAVKAWEFEKAGEIALSCHLLPEWYGAEAHHQAEAEGVAERLDELHLRKIDMADRLFVVNADGYIGESTRREIEYATKIGKPVEYLQPIARAATDAGATGEPGA
jgi:hypothetical protein